MGPALSPRATTLCGERFAMGREAEFVSWPPHTEIAAGQGSYEELTNAGIIERLEAEDGKITYRGTDRSCEIGWPVMSLAARHAMTSGPFH